MQGSNAYVMYNIEGSDCFFIEWHSGVVRTSCLLDREIVPSYQVRRANLACYFVCLYLLIHNTGCSSIAVLVQTNEAVVVLQVKLIAKASGATSLSSTAKLTIFVTDIDDNHPHFSTNTYR